MFPARWTFTCSNCAPIPTIFLNVDRTRAQTVGLSQQDVANSVLLTLSSSFQINPSFWVNPANGMNTTWPCRCRSTRSTRCSRSTTSRFPPPLRKAPQILGNLGRVNVNVEPALITHYNSQPMIDVYASVEGRDLGGVDEDIQKVLKEFQSKLPRGTQLCSPRASGNDDFFVRGAGRGVGVAIVLVYLLIVVNFQSWIDPFIIITALPGALAGIVWMLLLTHTTLSVPSLTGTIMCMGVATANSILMVPSRASG